MRCESYKKLSKTYVKVYSWNYIFWNVFYKAIRLTFNVSLYNHYTLSAIQSNWGTNSPILSTSSIAWRLQVVQKFVKKYSTTTLHKSYFNFVFEWQWWCYPTPSEGWGRGGTPQKPNSRATPQGLGQRLKMEELVPKMARRRGSDAGQSRRRWVVSCRGYTNVSPPQRGGAVPAPLFVRWAEMARQLPRGARSSGRPQLSIFEYSC